MDYRHNHLGMCMHRAMDVGVILMSSVDRRLYSGVGSFNSLSELVAVTFKKLLPILCNEFVTGPTGKLLWREVVFLRNDI